MIAPRLVGEAIDLILPGSSGSLLVMLGWIALCYVGGSLLNWLTSLCANLVANRTVCELRTDLFRKLGKMPLKYFDAHSHGDMMSRFSNDIDAISDGLNQGLYSWSPALSPCCCLLASCWRSIRWWLWWPYW